MARRGRSPVEITLTGTERRQLQSWSSRHSSAHNLAVRCKTILLCEGDSLTGAEIRDIVGLYTNPPVNAAEFIKFLNRINREVPDHLDVHVILDNLSTHQTPAVHKWLLRHRRLHFTPSYG